MPAQQQDAPRIGVAQVEHPRRIGVIERIFGVIHAVGKEIDGKALPAVPGEVIGADLRLLQVAITAR